jgi:hypothetical protein
MKVVDYFIFKSVIDEESHEVIASFRNSYLPDRIWKIIKRTKKARIMWGDLPEWNAIKLQHAVHSEYFDFTEIGDFAGKYTIIYFEAGEITKFEICLEEGKTVSILPEEIRKQSGWFYIAWPELRNRKGKTMIGVSESDHEIIEQVDSGLFKETMEKILREAGLDDPEVWYDIFLEIGDTKDTDDMTAEEIVAKKYHTPVSRVLKVINMLRQNKDMRDFLLGGINKPQNKMIKKPVSSTSI